MKKFLFPTIMIAFSCIFVSCNNANSGSGMSDKAKKNLENAQAIAKMFESSDWSKTGDYIAADAVDHANPEGEVKGLDSIKASFAKMNTMMGDFKNEVVKELADDDYVFQWMKETATAKIPFMGMKAGERKTFSVIEVSKFNADSKVSEHWTFMDMTAMMSMMPKDMGNMGNTNPPNTTDTSKMQKK